MGQVQALIAQVRSQPWAPGDLAILLGELSRDGVNFAQNRAYQALEISNTDPNIGFVSSAGLVSDDRNGVHFNGDALVQFGARYAEVLHDIRDGAVAGPNTAPTVNLAVPHATSLTVIEGQELRISIGDYFVDAENDPLYYYSFLDKRNVYMARADQITDELVLTPDFDDAGHYKISLYANDYLLDGETLTIDVTVIQATPLVNTYSNRNFDTQIGSYRDFTVGMDSLSRNRGLEILDQSALSANGPTVITLESLHVRADAAIVGNFILADDVQRAYFYGLGRFDVTGNDLDNYIVGSDGANTVHGGAGLDRIYGNGGADRLFGDDGNDQLFGGSGVDYLDAGPGSDMVYGGGQGDTFVFDRGDQQLQVRDYDGTDTILLRNFAGIADFSDLLASATVRQSASRTIIDISTDRLVIWDMTVDALNADMFGFA
jgi:Ca2+-binding RTX toxin-like protein